MLDGACKQNREEVSPAPCRALYVHVPFCRSKCRYCDFYSRTFDPVNAAAFVRASATELATNLKCLGLPLASVFIGGGTPSVLGPGLLRTLLGGPRTLIDGRTEFSVEVNPGTVDEEVAAVLVECGVNRVNVGGQSFHADELSLLGRIHSPRDIRAAVAAIRSTGIRNIGLDLIYGIPGQTLTTWRSSLEQALSLQPEHLSCYALSFEEGTPLNAGLLAGRVAEMDEALQRECYYTAIAAARAAGLEHYETSNFARPGRWCRHNLTYWHNEPYLGIGPAAASYLGGVRRTNAADLESYAAALARGQAPPSSAEHLTGRRAMAETLMLALRLTQGVDRAWFMGRFGQDPAAAFPRSIHRYAQQGVLLVEPSHIRIAPERFFVADTILADIVEEGMR